MKGADLTLRHLAAFVAVAETRHFGRAAARLHLAQPAVSQQIRRLESLLGVRLLERDRRGTAVTEAGRALLPEARRVLAAADDAVEAAVAAARGDSGRLRLGVAPSANAAPVLDVLRALIDATPRLRVEVRELRQRELVDALRHGELDLAVGAVLRLPPSDTGISWRAVAREPFVIALPARHPLARTADPVSLTDIDGEPFVSFARDDGPRYDDTLRGLLAAAEVVPGQETVVRERATQLALVAAGLGVALVPAGAQPLHTTGIAYRALRERAPVLTTVAAWRTGDTGPVLARVLDRLRSCPAGRPSIPAATSTGGTTVP